MNIDIVNKQIAAKLGLKQDTVRLVNQFFWRNVHDHLYSYNPRPVDIQNVCVLYPEQWALKRHILMLVGKLRAMKNNKKFAPNSPRQIAYIEGLQQTLRGYLKLRKQNKFTN